MAMVKSANASFNLLITKKKKRVSLTGLCKVISNRHSLSKFLWKMNHLVISFPFAHIRSCSPFLSSYPGLDSLVPGAWPKRVSPKEPVRRWRGADQGLRDKLQTTAAAALPLLSSLSLHLARSRPGTLPSSAINQRSGVVCMRVRACVRACFCW